VIDGPPGNRGAGRLRHPLRTTPLPTTLLPMPDLPQIPPDELARRLDRGDRVQVLDIRAPERVARGRVTFGAALDFTALPGSRLYQLPTLDALGFAPGTPVAVICGHGNSSKQMTAFLRDKGVDAYSVVGGMAAWETVYVTRSLTPTPSFERVLQLDRVGTGALSYVLVSDGEALVVDPGRHVDRYEALLRELGARPIGVADTHMHADYLSGARVAAARWNVPYYVHADDARSPYDDAPGRFAYRSLADGDRLALGRAIAPGQRARAAQLVEDRIQALDRQVAVLRKLRECVDQPDGTAGLDLLDLRTGSVAWPALCSLPVADPATPQPATGTRSSEAGMTDGIILLVFIAALVAFGVTRARRRLGMGSATGRTWLIIMAAVILALAALWAYQTHGG